MRTIKGKHGWIRIVEAFIAVLMVLGVIMVIFTRQSAQTTRADEIIKMQNQILDYVGRDEALRAQVLADNTAGVNELVNRTVPPWLNYSVQICPPTQICPNKYGYIPEKEVYTNEILIVANLTKYDAKKLKLFFWEK